jgi:hypothetical protein
VGGRGRVRGRRGVHRECVSVDGIYKVYADLVGSYLGLGS